MSLRPQTLYALEDSPVGLAAWILDHDAGGYAMIAQAIDGQPEGLTIDDILDNITLYWLTNTAVSSARLYWDASQTAKKGFFDVKGVVAVPFGVSAYPDEIYTARSAHETRSAILARKRMRECHEPHRIAFRADRHTSRSTPLYRSHSTRDATELRPADLPLKLLQRVPLEAPRFQSLEAVRASGAFLLRGLLPDSGDDRS
jgi:hypothetical protein